MKLYISLKSLFYKKTVETGKYFEIFELTLFSLASFLVPVFIAKPQIVVGSLVNFLIIRSAYSMKGWKNFPTIIIPSLAVSLRGVLFGRLTYFLLVFVPVIWLGNFVLSLMVKLTIKSPAVVRVSIPAVSKAALLFIPAIILFQLNVLPGAYLYSMGPVQLLTALAGGVLANGFNSFTEKLLSFEHK